MVTSFEIFHIYLVLRLGCYVYYLGGSVYFNILLNMVLIKDDSLAFCINNQQILGLMFIFLLYCSWKPRKSNSAHPKSTILKVFGIRSLWFLGLCSTISYISIPSFIYYFSPKIFHLANFSQFKNKPILVNLKINPWVLDCILFRLHWDFRHHLFIPSALSPVTLPFTESLYWACTYLSSLSSFPLSFPSCPSLFPL